MSIFSFLLFLHFHIQIVAIATPMIKATAKPMINDVRSETRVWAVDVAIGAGSFGVGVGNGKNGCVLIK